MTEFVPNRKVKYFFGYYDLFGQAAPMVWAEEDGIVVGGIPTPVLQRHEISEGSYEPNQCSLIDLTKKYPLQLDMKTVLPKRDLTDLT